MKKIHVVTSSRAEFGLLNNVIKELQSNENILCEVLVTGSHLSEKLGFSVSEVMKECTAPIIKIPIQEAGSTPLDTSRTMANAIERFSVLFTQNRPDAIVLLGDRYEIFAVAAAATNFLIPIAHLYGGETTQGAVDEAFRHSITKMSSLHFTATEDYRRRVIQLGEDPKRVFYVGSTGVENIHTIELMDLPQLEESIGFQLTDRYAVGTFHPVTLEERSARSQSEALIEACCSYDDIHFLFTKANADTDGDVINTMLEEAAEQNPNIHLVSSLGYVRYLSALSHALFVIGNSSSGIVEAPSFKIPTVNIGDRQKGRTMTDSIINCGPDTRSIRGAIDRALTMDCSNVVNPFEKAGTSHVIANTIAEHVLHDDIVLKKEFFDL